MLTKTEVACEAMSAGQRAVGLALGVPFFVVLFIFGLVKPETTHGPWGAWAINYIVLVVFPLAACLSCALSAFAAPAGQERAYARAVAFGCSLESAALALFLASLHLYALWPFATVRAAWMAVVEQPGYGPPVLWLITDALLSPVFASFGYVAGCRASSQEPPRLLACLLKHCWKLSRKRNGWAGQQC